MGDGLKVHTQSLRKKKADLVIMKPVFQEKDQ